MPALTEESVSAGRSAQKVTLAPNWTERGLFPCPVILPKSALL
jgi:hypothetical protein